MRSDRYDGLEALQGRVGFERASELERELSAALPGLSFRSQSEALGDGSLRALCLWAEPDTARTAVSFSFEIPAGDPGLLRFWSWWTEPDYRRRGFFAKLNVVLVRWGEPLGFERVEIAGAETDSEPVFERAGYRRTGETEMAQPVSGPDGIVQYVDHAEKQTELPDRRA